MYLSQCLNIFIRGRTIKWLHSEWRPILFRQTLLTTECGGSFEDYFFIKPTPSKIFCCFLLRAHRKGWVGRYLIKISVAPLEPFSISPTLAVSRWANDFRLNIHHAHRSFFNLNLFSPPCFAKRVKWWKTIKGPQTLSKSVNGISYLIYVRRWMRKVLYTTTIRYD